MAYCSRCGKELAEGAFFCSGCGSRTPAGEAAGKSYPAIEDVKIAFIKAGDEIDKAFTQAGKELDKAYKDTRQNIRSTLKGNPIVCKNCGQENPKDSIYCRKCGKQLV
jgi:ribosomal protein L40E